MCLCLQVNCSSLTTSDEFGNEKEEIANDEIKKAEKEEVKETKSNNEEEQKVIMEDVEAQTSTALEPQNDPDTEKHKGCKCRRKV